MQIPDSVPGEITEAGIEFDKIRERYLSCAYGPLFQPELWRVLNVFHSQWPKYLGLPPKVH